MKVWLATLAVLYCIVAYMDSQDRELQKKDYCEQVQLYKQSRGQQGWPAYDNSITCEVN